MQVLSHEVIVAKIAPLKKRRPLLRRALALANLFSA
jgi:hypothetical protein